MNRLQVKLAIIYQMSTIMCSVVVSASTSTLAHTTLQKERRRIGRICGRLPILQSCYRCYQFCDVCKQTVNSKKILNCVNKIECDDYFKNSAR